MAETIEEVLKGINAPNEGIFLPYIQRDFVWDKERICNLLDSLMRRYPIGSILAWKTDDAVSYRRFSKHYTPDYEADENMLVGQKGETRRYILDGQQRLQSLYIVRHGSYDGEEMFFNLSSNPKDEFGYVFEFKKPDFKQAGWLNVKEFLKEQKDISVIPTKLKEAGVIPTHFSSAVQDEMGANATRLYMVFRVFQNLHLTTLTADDGIDIDDIAEVFVRINSEGVVLEKADLLMALIKSEWEDAGEQFKRLSDTVISMGYSKHPKDFVLRACLALLNGEPGGTKDDAKLFADAATQAKLKENFKDISAAICDVMRFIAEFNFIHAHAVPTFNPVLLLIAYRYHHTQKAWENIKTKAKRFLFATFLSKALTKPPVKLMKALLDYVSTSKEFEASEIEKICLANGKDLKIDIDALLKTSMYEPLADLILHLFYTNAPGYNPNEMIAKDHIFPQTPLSRVREGGRLAYSKKERDSILNCELLSPNDNALKSDMLPSDYLPKWDNAHLSLHGIPSQEFWDMSKFKEFKENRRGIMKVRIEKNLEGFIR